MKILVRLPNWLGDMVMSVGFIRQLQVAYEGAEIHLIVKHGLQQLVPYFPGIAAYHVFSKQTHKGLLGVWKFGRELGSNNKFDLFFCLPNSFSSAFMGLATGAGKRIGYQNELRSLLLTHSFRRPEGIHRVEEYTRLLDLYRKSDPSTPEVSLDHSFLKEDYIVLNINSEASSRRLTVHKAVEFASKLMSNTDKKILMMGSPKEKKFVDEVVAQLNSMHQISNIAGKTSLNELVKVLASATLMISTDSGPAHLANALGTQTVVLFGAGREAHTAPYNKFYRQVFRLGKLSCEPCEKNVCVRYGTPQCLERLDVNFIIHQALSNASK